MDGTNRSVADGPLPRYLRGASQCSPFFFFPFRMVCVGRFFRQSAPHSETAAVGSDFSLSFFQCGRPPRRRRREPSARSPNRRRRALEGDDGPVGGTPGTLFPTRDQHFFLCALWRPGRTAGGHRQAVVRAPLWRAARGRVMACPPAFWPRWSRERKKKTISIKLCFFFSFSFVACVVGAALAAPRRRVHFFFFRPPATAMRDRRAKGERGFLGKKGAERMRPRMPSAMAHGFRPPFFMRAQRLGPSARRTSQVQGRTLAFCFGSHRVSSLSTVRTTRLDPHRRRSKEGRAKATVVRAAKGRERKAGRWRRARVLRAVLTVCA